MAFVEVKTRASAGFGPAVGAVTAAKCRTLARIAAVWRDRHGRRGDRYRFDVVTVWLGGGGAVEHLADAWRLRSTWVA